MATLEDLTKRANAVHTNYRRGYAGRSRVTRDPAGLDPLVAELQQIRAQAGDIADSNALIGQVDGWIQLYRGERAEIVKAREAGPDEFTAARINDWVWLSTRRYSRHFAGRERSTRDTGLLDEMRSDLRGWKAELETLAGRNGAGWKADLIQRIQSDIDLYDNERVEVPKALKGLPAARQGTALARAANGQFTVYRVHFQGKPRTTRRLALLERSRTVLTDVLMHMQALKAAGFASESNDGNIEKVRQRIDLMDRELPAIRQARASTSPADLTSALAKDANTLFNAYRTNFAGKPRSDADPDLLSEICDQLFEIARQMNELVRETGLEVNRKNLDTVVENLKLYEREFQSILDAKRGS